jgi:2-keto-4-pentenoate hydratase/2-oxohepta-3-ene-1,7-dioic acid hydratase in catechol pathway
MRLARDADGRPLLGDDAGFVPLAAAHPAHGTVRSALAAAAAGRLDPHRALARPRSVDHFATPLPDPGTLWGIGLNYAGHAADLDARKPEEPASFMRPATAATGPGGPIRLPATDRVGRVTAEAELGLVIGRTVRGVDVADALDAVAGAVPVIDATAEDVVKRNPRFLTRSKCFDDSLVVGPWIETDPGELSDIEVRTVVDGAVRARGAVSEMLFPPAELVAFHAETMTLQPGDLICTGTPGAHPIDAGDTVRAEVTGVGTVETGVVDD